MGENENLHSNDERGFATESARRIGGANRVAGLDIGARGNKTEGESFEGFAEFRIVVCFFTRERAGTKIVDGERSLGVGDQDGLVVLDQCLTVGSQVKMGF